MIEDITNYNDKTQLHGYQEWYLKNIIYLRGNYKHGKFIGYIEWHDNAVTTYYIK